RGGRGDGQARWRRLGQPPAAGWRREPKDERLAETTSSVYLPRGDCPQPTRAFASQQLLSSGRAVGLIMAKIQASRGDAAPIRGQQDRFMVSPQHSDLPPAQGLYDPRNEHDSCGVGFLADIKGRKSHAIIRQALSILVNPDHRGAVGADPLVGDGAGCLIQIPDALLRDWARKNAVDLPAPGHYAVAVCFLPQDEAARKFAVKRL